MLPEELISSREQPVEKEILAWLEQLVGQDELRTAGGAGSGNFGHAGRPGEIGGSAEGFGAAPLGRAGAAKWHKQQQERYDNDPEFRAAVDSVTLMTQSSTHLIRAASVAAAEGDEALIREHYTERLDGPLSGAANPLASYKNYFEGQDVEHADYVTLREAGVALNKAIDTSPVLDEPIYRGMPVSHQAFIGAGQTLDPISGHVVITDEKAYKAERNRPFDEQRTGYVVNPFMKELDALKPGVAFNIPGVTSFTTDKFMAEQFSRGEARGQGASSRSGGARRTFSAVTLEVRGARGLPVSALSPWNQNEVLTRGSFKVESVTKTPYRGAINDYHIVLKAQK